MTCFVLSDPVVVLSWKKPNGQYVSSSFVLDNVEFEKKDGKRMYSETLLPKSEPRMLISWEQLGLWVKRKDPEAPEESDPEESTPEESDPEPK
jgi:hypothetical protein